MAVDQETYDRIKEFLALSEEFGGDEKIPSDKLYAYLLKIKQDLINVAKLGSEKVTENRMGREVRRRSKTDLMWLARYFTWETNPASDNGANDFASNIFDEEFYGIFTELFVKKDPSKPINKQSDYKRRLLLWPRGGAKSSFDHVDTVQWILCFPNIRILYLTAAEDLAVGFVGEIKGHFYIKEEPTLMNIFFPEYCVEEGKAGAANTFTCPVYAAKKTGRKEPTVYASSVGKNKAGGRYELIKADDAVSDVNSKTESSCRTTSKDLSLAEKLLRLGGYYIDFIGTRYALQEHYGVVLEKNIGKGEETRGVNWVFTKCASTSTLILVGKAIEIKPEVHAQLELEGKPVTYEEVGPEGCTLLLPHLMSYAWCLQDYDADPDTFESQRNQNPVLAINEVISRDMLLRATIDYTKMPRVGPVSQFWDFSFSEKKKSDFCTGASVVWSEEPFNDEHGRPTGATKTVANVRKIIRKKLNPFTLAQEIVKLAKEERPFIIGIEKAGGSNLLQPTIESEAIKTGDPHVIAVCSHIDWVTPSNKDGAKRIRMGGLIPWLKESRLKFANYCMAPEYPNLEILYSEFEKCLVNAGAQNGIPDTLAYQTNYAPRATIAISTKDSSSYGFSTGFDRQGYGQIFDPRWGPGAGFLGDDGEVRWYEQPAPAIGPEPESMSTPSRSGLPNILGDGLNG